MKKYMPHLVGVTLVAVLLIVGFGGGNLLAVVGVIVAWIIMLGLGLMIGVQVGESRSRSSMRRIQQTCSDALARLAVQEETDASLRASVDRHKLNARLSAELAESHLAQLNELRALVAGRVTP